MRGHLMQQGYNYRATSSKVKSLLIGHDSALHMTAVTTAYDTLARILNRATLRRR